MKFGQQLYNGIFPQAINLSAKDQQLLQQMYPNIDWNYVRYYNSIPWFMHFSTTIGTALPDSYNSRFINVYFRNFEEMPIYQKLLILVHEAFHIQQYQELSSMGKKTTGWGFNRRFMRYYLGWYFQSFYQAIFKLKRSFKDASHHAYRQHPMEVPAYDHEAHFEAFISDYRGHAVGVFFQQNPSFIIHDSKLPQAPSFVFHLMGSGLALFISLIKPLVEFFLLLPIAYLLGGRKQL